MLPDAYLLAATPGNTRCAPLAGGTLVQPRAVPGNGRHEQRRALQQGCGAAGVEHRCCCKAGFFCRRQTRRAHRRWRLVCMLPVNLRAEAGFVGQGWWLAVLQPRNALVYAYACVP